MLISHMSIESFVNLSEKILLWNKPRLNLQYKMYVLSIHIVHWSIFVVEMKMKERKIFVKIELAVVQLIQGFGIDVEIWDLDSNFKNNQNCKWRFSRCGVTMVLMSMVIWNACDFMLWIYAFEILHTKHIKSISGVYPRNQSPKASQYSDFNLL